MADSFKPGSLIDVFRGAPFEGNDSDWEKWVGSLAVKVETGELRLRDALFIAELAGQRRGRDAVLNLKKIPR